MVGYKVDVGYVNNYPISSDSDITYLDFDAPFTIMTEGGFKLLTEVTADIILSEYSELLGNDFYYLYGLLNYSSVVSQSSDFTTFFTLFPSIIRAYPNCYQYSINHLNTRWAFKFKQLKKYYIINNSTGAEILNDNFIMLGSSRYNLPPCSYMNQVAGGSGIAFQYLYVSDYTNSGDLVRATSAKIIYFGGSRWSTRDGVNDIARYLFESATEPDFSIQDGPYGPGGNSGEGDLPPGTFDDTSDPIPDSSLPSISAADTGFTRIYNPTLSQVQALARYLWTDVSILDTIWNHIKQFFEDPMQAIIGFNLVPCRVPDGGTRSFALMYIDTGVQMTAAANQFVDVDCGTLELQRYYGSALDQNPYTKVSCYLPYIGTVHLNTDEVMGTTLHVKYRIDIVSGSCVAKILVDGSVLYQYSGHCAINIPISAADFSSYVSSAITVGTALAGMAVGAAAGGAASAQMVPPVAPASAGAIAPSTALATVGPPSDFQQQAAIFTHNMNVATQQNTPTQSTFMGLTPENIVNTAGQTMGSKMQVEHSGAFSGNSGYLGVRRPFLIIERPNMCLPETYGQLNGYPSMITLKLGDCKGFTRVQQVQLTGCTATNPEQSEILQFLKSGVVL